MGEFVVVVVVVVVVEKTYRTQSAECIATIRSKSDFAIAICDEFRRFATSRSN